MITSRIDLDSVSRELVAGLPHELSNPKASRTDWTRAVVGGLGNIGKARKLWVCCRKYKDYFQDQGEWLLDLVWMNQSENSIVLAAESEWGGISQFDEDFAKLLSLKAWAKIFLFDSREHRGSERMVAKIEGYMGVFPYHLSGEDYLLIEATKQGAFRYHFQVLDNGSLSSVKFIPWETLPWPWTRVV
ncbi:MAG TPA: hypothetical protein VG267_03265 [Terracidiphilus sp.]|nr:hypothetical protein [Terracidiphilus sp.]